MDDLINNSKYLHDLLVTHNVKRLLIHCENWNGLQILTLPICSLIKQNKDHTIRLTLWNLSSQLIHKFHLLSLFIKYENKSRNIFQCGNENWYPFFWRLLPYIFTKVKPCNLTMWETHKILIFKTNLTVWWHHYGHTCLLPCTTCISLETWLCWAEDIEPVMICDSPDIPPRITAGIATDDMSGWLTFGVLREMIVALKNMVGLSIINYVLIFLYT